MNEAKQRLTTLAKADAKKLVSAKFGKLGLLTIIINLIISLPVFFIIFTNIMQIISATLRFNVGNIITSTVSLLIAGVLIITPITFGQIKCYYDVYKTGDFHWKTLFIAFETLESYTRALKYGILMFAKLILWAIPLIIAIYIGFMQAIFLVFSYIVYGNFVIPSVGILLAMIIISIILTIIIVLKTVKYYAGYLTLIDNAEIGCKGAIRQGIETLKGYDKELVYFGFSFILWYLLSTITYGIATFFTVPYMFVSIITLVKKISDEKRELADLKERELEALKEVDNITLEELNNTPENISSLANEELDSLNQKLENKDIDN